MQPKPPMPNLRRRMNVIGKRQEASASGAAPTSAAAPPSSAAAPTSSAAAPTSSEAPPSSSVALPTSTTTITTPAPPSSSSAAPVSSSSSASPDPPSSSASATTPPPASSSASTTPPPASSSSVAPPSSSSAAPPSSASSAAPPSSSAEPSSTSVVTTTVISSVPPSSASSAASSSAPQSSSTTTVIVTPSSSATSAASSAGSQTSVPPTTTSTLFVSASSSTASSAVQSDITASSAVGVETTVNGQRTTVTPSSFTSNIVQTSSDGVVYTVTQIVHNPSGALDGGSGGKSSTSAFFSNKGAVAGVFVVVGLVVVGIIFALGLLCFRRRRRQRLDREVTAAAVAASHNTGRSPLDEDADIHSSGPNTSESYPSTVNQPMAQYGNYGASYGPAGGYDPYAHPDQQQYYHPGPQGGYDAPLGAAVGAGGYGSLQQGQQGYYFDPNEAEQYHDLPSSQMPLADGHHGGYDDPYAYNDNGYSTGGNGSADNTPLERENPLHVTNPSHHRAL